MSGVVRTVLGDVEPDEDRAAGELGRFRAAGEGAIVEATTPEFGRDLRALRRLAERTGVRIVAVTGRVSSDCWRGALDLDSHPEADLVAKYLSDISDGAGIGAACLDKEMVPCLLVDNPSRFLAWR